MLSIPNFDLSIVTAGQQVILLFYPYKAGFVNLISVSILLRLIIKLQSSQLWVNELMFGHVGLQIPDLKLAFVRTYKDGSFLVDNDLSDGSNIRSKLGLFEVCVGIVKGDLFVAPCTGISVSALREANSQRILG